jgi:hypothetical protein
MMNQVGDLEAFANEVAGAGFTHAVLLGMGGSSLAPEVLRRTFGVRPGRLELTVLDNTSPAAVRAVESAHDLERTLFIVSSKSGTTLEVSSFERYFHARVGARLGDRAGASFVAITDPGTPLERLARERGYRRVFSNPPDIGGRYSALSYFGLVPAALIGADVAGLLTGALKEAEMARHPVPAGDLPVIRLGVGLGELALGGRDKLTLVIDPEIGALGAWIEQLIAESTGKLGRGIVPIVDEPLGSPDLYGEDRLFVSISVAGMRPAAEDPLVPIVGAGNPVMRRWHADLGGEFMRWEIATAVAGAVLEVDPFDEPNVTEAKQATQAVLQRYLADGRFPVAEPLARSGDRAAYAPPAVARSFGAPANDDPSAAAAALLSLGRPGDYVAILAYVHRTPERHARLERARLAARARTRLATTLGYGPRFLHSTGQLHKGGPNTGLFLLLTADEGAEIAIPGERYGFGVLRDAQAAGDYEVLERRGRRVVRIHLGADVESALDRLVEAVAAPARI